MDSIEVGATLDRVRETAPLIHNITNYVTVNDCANALLAIGASPIMSDEAKDVGDIASICDGLVLNIGTLNERTVKSMFIAGSVAGKLDHPIVLDPVGAGASALRSQTAADLLDRLEIAIVRGNMSEAKALAGVAASTRGVDACTDDAVNDANLAEAAAFAKDFAARTGTVAAITGAIDVVADAHRAFAVRNGSSLQGRITGAGCMLSCLTGAFAVANADHPLEAALGAVCTMGVAGQIAQMRMSPLDGNGSFRMYLLDALYNLDGKTLAEEVRITEV